jgi:tellurite resistance protein
MPKVDELFKEYGAARKHDLSNDQFTAILKIVPGLLIASSDGVMDSKELNLVNKFSKMMGDELIPDDVEGATEKEEKLMKDIRSELQFIMKNTSTWKEKILDALSENIQGDKKQKEFVGEIMHMFASTSGGYSKEEEKKIDEMYARLSL